MMMLFIFVINFLCYQLKKTLKILMFSSFDNIEKFIPKNNHTFLFHVLFHVLCHVKTFAMKIFVQDNELSLRWIASTEKNCLFGTYNLS